MRTISQAILFYGVLLPEETPDAWVGYDLRAWMDDADQLTHILLQQRTLIGYSGSDQHPQHYLAIAESEHLARRRQPQRLTIPDPLFNPDDWNYRVLQTCRLLGVTVAEPCAWYLVSKLITNVTGVKEDTPV